MADDKKEDLGEQIDQHPGIMVEFFTRDGENFAVNVHDGLVDDLENEELSMANSLIRTFVKGLLEIGMSNPQVILAAGHQALMAELELSKDAEIIANPEDVDLEKVKPAGSA